jgi:hypothetical protein
MATIDAETYNIKEASQATGLTPSVLRIWELRYGWPNPRRKPNGYRTYLRHQIDDLRKVATLVRSGMPISSIIVDGLPRWPAQGMGPPSPRLLPRTRALPVPSDAHEAILHRDLVQAFANLNPLAVKELLQRIFWTVRPCDEPRTALVPALVALAELREGNKPMPEAEEIAACVQDRCVQLMRMNRIESFGLVVVPMRAADSALAHLAAIMLGHRGLPARPWTEAHEPSAPYLVAGEGESMRRSPHLVGAVSTMGSQNALSLAQLLDATQVLPWAVPAPP